MMTVRSWVLILVLVLLVGGVVIAKKTVFAPKPETELERIEKAIRVADRGESNAYPGPADPEPAASGIPELPLKGDKLAASLANGKPTLVDFGAGTCEQCKREAPVLNTAFGKYQGKANVVFVDTNTYGDLARKYGVKFIPTQIFFDRQGKEVSRHTGYHPWEAVVADFAKAGAPSKKAGVK